MCLHEVTSRQPLDRLNEKTRWMHVDGSLVIRVAPTDVIPGSCTRVRADRVYLPTSSCTCLKRDGLIFQMGKAPPAEVQGKSHLFNPLRHHRSLPGFQPDCPPIKSTDFRTAFKLPNALMGREQLSCGHVGHHCQPASVRQNGEGEVAIQPTL